MADLETLLAEARALIPPGENRELMLYCYGDGSWRAGAVNTFPAVLIGESEPKFEARGATAVEAVAGLIESLRGVGSHVVARDEIGDVVISTAFIGTGDDDSSQAQFETVIFGGALDQRQEIYSTLDEARAGHALMVSRVRAAQCAKANDGSD
jgi:hypothetical protein